ncbi:hypothetical protein HF576_01805 [Microbacterium sp. CFH 90308]|uniref:Uncharacterized protein n=1 Tax=Microbacterium salsuginis TaxID=2722803 RepID=A0ABX1K6D5_9MICO|nr:hypothetical protein [Microbacterium sp. CFH 90308]NLP82573.1 hypothetical protein [Microbacterium sp. CFH 90308]
MAGRTQVFLAADSTMALRADASTSAVVANEFPVSQFDWGFSDECRWTVGVEQVLGAPTSWQLKPVLQFAVMHTTGQRLTKPRWYDVPLDQVEALTREGADFAMMSAAPSAQSRSLVGYGKWMRIVLKPTFEGGTDPRLLVALIAETK